MTTNGEWLFSKPFEEQVAWMDEEHHDGTLDGDTAALNARIAELELQLEEHREGWNHAIDGWQKAGKRVDELLTHMEKLTAERDEWKEHSRKFEYRCKEAEADCETYREKFGKCLDYADAIHALMDDEGMA